MDKLGIFYDGKDEVLLKSSNGFRWAHYPGKLNREIAYTITEEEMQHHISPVTLVEWND